MAAETGMMGRTPAFYSPLHSMAWAGAFTGAGAGAGGGTSASSPTPPSKPATGQTHSSFGYPPTPPKESPGGATPGSLHSETGQVSVLQLLPRPQAPFSCDIKHSHSGGGSEGVPRHRGLV